MGCDIEDVEQEKYDMYGLQVFSNGNEEWAIGTEEEADQAVRQYIEDSVWTFRPEFIASHTRGGATNGIIKAIAALQESSGDCNEDVKSLIEDLDKFAEEAVSSDGRGTFLSPYDSFEVEIEIDGETFYCYRTN